MDKTAETQVPIYCILYKNMISLQKITKNAFWHFFKEKLNMSSNLKEIIQYVLCSEYKGSIDKKLRRLLKKAN